MFVQNLTFTAFASILITCGSSEVACGQPELMPGYEQNSTLTLGSLTSVPRASARHVQFLYIDPGADPHSLRDPTLFSNLKVVVLRAADNAAFLKVLSAGYPNIKSLCISQSQPLSKLAAQQLKRFRELTALELNCPTADCEELSASLPRSLELLRIQKPLNLAGLSHLKNLILVNTEVGSSFFRELNACPIEYLTLDSMIVQPGAIEVLKNFKDLKVVTLKETAVPEQELLRLRETNVRIVNANDPFPRKLLVAPLRPEIPHTPD